ncbi:MAG: hypothetical protein KAS96_10105 [Planctomycetes bacterium]|nr:hypothetical protein [Planctomycetota bacterium]
MQSKQEYIDEAKKVLWKQLDNHFRVNDEGEIIRIDEELIFWLNGITCGWDIATQAQTEEERISHEDLIPNFKKIYDDSKRIYPNSGHFGEYCSLYRW